MFTWFGNFDLHPLDWVVLVVYFVVVTFLGVVVGKKQTKSLGDFFVAGGKWGSVVAFVFVFASAVGGAEAVVVAGAAYEGGLSGVWYWWSGLFGIIIYFLFGPVFKRSRVFNSAEFFEMRFGPGVATTYAVLSIAVLVGTVALFALAGGKSIAGLTGLETHQAVLIAGVVVAAYVGSGGLMSSLLTDLFQGLMTLTAFCFLLLPFLWTAAGGFDGLRTLPPESWSLSSKQLPPGDILALVITATFGAISSPFIFSLIVVARDERASTQCGWAHLWKRTVTILFAIYGLLFVLYKPNLVDPELAWGIVMKELLPAGLLGLLIASFFAALMSTVDTHSASSAGVIVDYLFRKRLFRRRTTSFYMRCASVISIAIVFLSCAMALQFESLQHLIKFLAPFSFILSVPIYFGVVWRKANRQGVWAALSAGMFVYMICKLVDGAIGRAYAQNPDFDQSSWVGFWTDYSFEVVALLPALVSVVAMYLVSKATHPESDVLLNRFYCILNTPIGQDPRLRDVGIRLPAMERGSIGEEADPQEQIDAQALEDLYQSYAAHKFCGRDSNIETLKERGLGWYYRGAGWLTGACLLLIGGLWLAARLMAGLSLAQ